MHKMNEIFSFHRELNIKKILFVSILILLILIFIINAILELIQARKEKKLEEASPNSIFYDDNNSISLELSKQYGLTQYTSTEDYLIELRSENNLDIFISCKQLLKNRSLYDIAYADSLSYKEEFNNYSNLSEIKEFTQNDSLAYTYSLHYLDSRTKTTFYLQVIWIECENAYYIIDIEFPLDDLNNYTNIINETLDSFIIY